MLANGVRDALGSLEHLCSSLHVLSHSATLSALQTRQQHTPLLVCFVSATFPDDDIALLKQLCLAAREHAKIVAVSPVYDPNTILQVMRCGAVDYLDVNKAIEKDLANLIERLTSTQFESSRPGKLLSVMGPVGGAGASLLAVNLAVLCAQKDGTCGLLDLHLRGGDLGRLLNVTPRYTLASLVGKANVDVTMFEHALVQHESGVRLLTSPDPFTDYRQITPQLVQRVVQYARATFPYVIVDLEDVEHPEQVRLLAASDQVIIPLRPDMVSLYRTLKCLEYLSRANMTADRITIVVNRVGQPNELPSRRMSEILGLPIVYEIPDDPAAINASYNLGVPLVLAFPKGKTALRMQHLANGLRSGPVPHNGARQTAGWGNRIVSWTFSLIGLTRPSISERQYEEAVT
jgi:pilus assembly protein CpaE